MDQAENLTVLIKLVTNSALNVFWLTNSLCCVLSIRLVLQINVTVSVRYKYQTQLDKSVSDILKNIPNITTPMLQE